MMFDQRVRTRSCRTELTKSVRLKENSTKINRHLKNLAASEFRPTIK